MSKVDLKLPRITYLRNESGFPVVCLAYSRVSPDELRFGLSCHNPHDKFDRELARKIAVNRFGKKPMRFIFDVESATLHDVLHDLMLKLECGEYGVCKRVQKTASNYLNYNRV